MFRRFAALALVIGLISLALTAPGPAPAAPGRLGATQRYLPMVTKQNRSAIIRVREQLRWFYPGLRPKSYDLVLIADHSTAARFCWDSQVVCPVGERRADGEFAAIRRLVDTFLVQRNGQGADNRLALVTVGHMGATSGAAHMQVGLNMYSSQALARISTLYGTTAQPRVVPDAELTGQAAIPEALAFAAATLSDSQRYVDANGQPVQRLTLIMMAGVPNVFVDAPYRWQANGRQLFTACRNPDDPDAEFLYDPLVQYACLAPDPRYPDVRPPLRAAVELADGVRPQDPLRGQVDTVAALALGAGPSTDAMRFPLLAPDAHGRAATEQALSAWVDQFLLTFSGQARCAAAVEPQRVAAGAEVRIFRGDGTLAFQGVTNQSGTAVATLPEGAYELEISHNQVTAPRDPLAMPRDYGRIITAGAPAPAIRAPLIVPANSPSLEFAQEAVLTITDPAAGSCP